MEICVGGDTGKDVDAETNSDRHQRVKYIFNAARRVPRHLRLKFLCDACADDVETLREVERLLSARQSSKLVWEFSLTHAVAFAGNSRFEVRRRLGSGAFADVYLAFDLHFNERVAIKVLRRSEPVALAGFKREMRVLVGFSHPNAARVLELIEPETETGLWLLRMEFVDGITFSKFVRRADEAALKSAFVQLAGGLYALHQAGIIHRDVKPSNILVTPEGNVKLVDFGLARSVKGRAEGSRQTMAGTPPYMAPELKNGALATTASDWYAVGAVLYEALTGKLPNRKDPAGPTTQGCNVSDTLSALCMRLLRQNPLDRDTGEQVLRLLEGNEHRQAPGLHANIFVGRVDCLKVLRGAFYDTERQIGRTVQIHGGPGIGKTALVEHFLGMLRSSRGDARIFAARCYEGDSVRYKGLDELVDRLWRYLNKIAIAELDAVVPRDFLLLARMFPVLAGLTAIASLRFETPSIVDPIEFRKRAFDALLELLQRMASLYPLVLFIDDVQWADIDSIGFLSSLMLKSGVAPLLLILAYRTEAIGMVGSPVEALRNEELAYLELPLLELRVDEAVELASAIRPAGSAPLQLSGIERNPLLICQLCWYLNSVPAPTQGDIDIDAVVDARVTQLTPEAKRFLLIVVIAGSPLGLPVIRRAAEISEDISSVRDLLISQRLLRTSISKESRYDVFHDRIRAAVLKRLSNEERRCLHLQLALALDAVAPKDAESAATHFRDGGEPMLSARYFELAAGQAVATLAFHTAARLYEQVLALVPTRQDISLCIAESLVNAGDGARAARFFLLAADSAEPNAKLRFRIRATAHLLRAGQITSGTNLLQQLCAETGLSFPESRGAKIRTWLTEQSRLRVSGLRTHESLQLSQADADRLDVCWAAAVGLSVVDPLASSVFVTRHLRLALNSGNPTRLVFAFAAEATQCAHTRSGQRRARHLLEQALTCADMVKSDHASAFVLAMTAVVDSLSGQWRECLAAASRAAVMFQERCTGVTWEFGTATSFTFSSRWLLGRWNENARCLPAIIRDAEQNGDRYTEVTMHVVSGYHMTCLAANKPEEAMSTLDRVMSNWPNKGYDVQRLYSFICRVDIALYQCRSEYSWELVLENWPLACGTGLLRVTAVRVIVLDVCGRAALARAAESPVESRERQRFFSEAEKYARALEKTGESYGVALAALLRAGVAMSRRESMRAVDLLAFAELVFDEYGLAPWLSVTRIRRGRLLQSKDGQTLWESGMVWMKEHCVESSFAPLIATLTPGDWSL